MKKFSLLILAFFLSGCTGRELPLDPKFAPLVSVEEITDKLIAPHMVTTVFSHTYTPDMATFLTDYPAGYQRDALMFHEQVHAKRQTYEWLAKYVADPAFRWQEEKLGWEVEIRYRMSFGDTLNPVSVATVLSQNYTVGGVPMVSFNEAYVWAQSIH